MKMNGGNRGWFCGGEQDEVRIGHYAVLLKTPDCSHRVFPPPLLPFF
jgi:hypothetical protein